MKKAKSLILQEVVSENPEKIHLRKRCEMGRDVGAFLRKIANKKQNIMDFVLELGENRNRRLGIGK